MEAVGTQAQSYIVKEIKKYCDTYGEQFDSHRVKPYIDLLLDPEVLLLESIPKIHWQKYKMMHAQAY